MLDVCGYRDVASLELADKLRGLRCTVLGAGGFLGGAVAARLASAGATVTGFGHLAARASLDERIAWSNAPLADRSSLARALEGRAVVFHFLSSSIPAASNVDPAASVRDDVYETVKVLDLARAAGVARVVFASSGGTVYGVPSIFPTPESAPTDPISAYGINKLMVEKYLALYRRLHGLDSISLRIANPYGPGQSPLKKQGVIATMVHAALAATPIEIWGTGEVTRDFVHVDDVVRAVLESAVYEGPEKVFNVGSGVGRSLNELLLDVQDALGGAPLSVERKAGRLADVPVSVLDTSLIERELGWRPEIRLRAGIADTAAWMREAFALR